MATAAKSPVVKSEPKVSAPIQDTPAVIRGNGPKTAPAALVGGDVSDALMGLGGISKPSASKSKSPSLALPAAVAPMLDAYLKALKEKKDAEAKIDDLFSTLSPHLEKMHVLACQSGKKYVSSIKVNSKATYLFGGKYKAITADKKVELVALFGVAFPQFFQAINEVKVKAETLDVEMIDDLKAICEKRGVQFSDLFEFKALLKPTEQYTEQRHVDPAVKKIADSAAESQLVSPYKATLKE